MPSESATNSYLAKTNVKTTVRAPVSTSVTNGRGAYVNDMYRSSYSKDMPPIHYPADTMNVSPKGYLTEAQRLPNLVSYPPNMPNSSSGRSSNPAKISESSPHTSTIRGPPPLKRAPGAPAVTQGEPAASRSEEPSSPKSPKIAKAPKVSILGDKKKSEKQPPKIPKRTHNMYTGRVANRPVNMFPEKMTCEDCNLDFGEVKEYSAHFQEQHGTYMCHICLKTFSNPSNRARHVKLHTGELSHICNVCGHGFSRIDLLKEHTRRHVTPFPFKCNICSKSYGARKALKNHIEKVHGSRMTHNCRFCCMGFDDAKEFKQHLQEEHAEEEKQLKANKKSGIKYGDEIHCKICGFTCYDVLSIAKHELIHTDDSKYNCVSCSQEFLDPIQFSLHFEDHSAEAGVFECCFCHQMISSYHEMLIHEATHVTGKAGLKVCVLCCNVLPESEVLADHMLKCSQSMTNTSTMSSPAVPTDMDDSNNTDKGSESDPFLPFDANMDWDEAEAVVKKSLEDATNTDPKNEDDNL